MLKSYFYTLSECPTIPCPGEFDDFIAVDNGSSGDGGASTTIIIIIVILLLILMVVIAFIVLLYFSPATREKIFKSRQKIKNSPEMKRPARDIGLKNRNSPIHNRNTYDDQLNETTPKQTQRRKRKSSDEVVLTDQDKSRLIAQDSRRSSNSAISSSGSSQQFDNPVYTMTHGDEGYGNVILDNIIQRETGELRTRIRSRDKSRAKPRAQGEQTLIQPGGPIAEFKQRERPRKPKRTKDRGQKNLLNSSFNSNDSLVLDGRKLKHFADFGEFDEDKGSLV